MEKILLIHPEGNYKNNPTLNSLVNILISKGIGVDILCGKSNDTYKNLNPNIKLYKDGSVWGKVKKIAINKLCIHWLASLVLLIDRLRFKLNDYLLLVGVDRQGIIEASVLRGKSSIPLGYISFEIMFLSETSLRYKRLEKIACNDLLFWLTQDVIRAEHLERENNLSEFNRIIIPLAATGKPKKTNRRLRDSLNIAKEKRVAITIGSLDNWTMTAEIITSLSYWPDNWVLIIHHRYGKTEIELDRIIPSWRQQLGVKIFISNYQADTLDSMSFVLNGVDCGLALYRSLHGNKYLGKNIDYIGLSSGKFSTYLRHAIPVITNEPKILGELVRLNDFGFLLEDLSQIEEALKRIEKSNAKYSISALDFYEKNIDFNLHKGNFMQIIENLSDKRE